MDQNELTRIATSFIPLMSPDINQQDIDAVADVLRSGMLVQGKEVETFENTIARFLGVKHAIAVSNGTATLHLALIASGISSGDEVIVPAFSYIATANVVELVGATPVFVDIDGDTFNIDVHKIEAAITSKTKAIVPVHEFGLSADIGDITEIAKKHKLLVIEDAACALGAKENNKYTGTFGNLGSFSFHPRKAITSGEGGLITTNDDKIASTIRILRNHGIEMQQHKMEFVLPGFNYRMTDFQAALVNSQFKRFENIVSQKSSIAEMYVNSIKNPKIKLPSVPTDKTHTWQTFHILLDKKLNREEVIAFLRSKNIGTNYGAQCMPAQKFFQQKYKLKCEDLFPNAINAYKQGLAIPIYEKLNLEAITYISEQLNKI